MAHDFHEISFKLGEITGQLQEINKNTAEIRVGFNDLSDRVSVIENEETFRAGVASQNKKIASVCGSAFGLVSGALMAWIGKVLS